MKTPGEMEAERAEAEAMWDVEYEWDCDEEWDAQLCDETWEEEV